jgi:hypothetical protein
MMSSSWEVVACLLVLRTEFNLVAPKRDKGADGTIGDSNHSSTSDHTPDEDSKFLSDLDSDKKNEVHGLDIDSTGPWPDGKGGQAGGWFDKKIHAIVAEEKRRWNSATDKCRLKYVIWRAKIAGISTNWEWTDYHGSSDMHYDHAHFSARYLTETENDKRPWGVYEEEGFMADISQANFNKLMDGWAGTANGKKLIGEAFLSAVVGSKEVPNRNVKAGLGDIFGQLRPALVLPANDKENLTSGLPANAPIRSLLALPANVSSLASQVSALATKVDAIKAKTDKFTSS